MKLARKSRLLILAGCLVVTRSLSAIVISPIKVKCPVCGEENEFCGFTAFGGYVYYYPSRFQTVFFPRSYPMTLWMCKKCHYTAWSSDFDRLDAKKIPDVQKAVEDAGTVPKFENYAEVPMPIRLEVAERVYRELKKDDLFWSDFYLAKGYHLGQCNKTEEARLARLTAREVIKRALNDPQYSARKKALLIS